MGARFSILHCRLRDSVSRPFHCQQFTVHQDRCAMKVGTDSLLLGSWAAVDQVSTVLDIGTGTGLLALMIAQRAVSAQIEAIEIDEAAAQQAVENVEQSPWGSRISVQAQSLQAFSVGREALYDLIICNPPFFVAGDGVASPFADRQRARQTDCLSHDRLLCEGARLLRPSGRIALVLPYALGDLFLDQAACFGLTLRRRLVVRPFPHKHPNRLLLELSVGVEPCLDEVLAIRDEPHRYSAMYRALTADFYLKGGSFVGPL